jgi:hypothetical protein
MTQICPACSSMTDDEYPQNSVADDEYGAKLMDYKYGV